MNNSQTKPSHCTFLSRRAFLKTVASTSLITGLPLSLVSCGHEDSLEATARYLIGQLEFPETANKVGRLYITLTPEIEKQSYENLTENILSILDVELDTLSTENFSLLDEKIREKVHQDFVDENVVKLKGWMLSKTEAMLCALASTYSKNLFILIT